MGISAAPLHQFIAQLRKRRGFRFVLWWGADGAQGICELSGVPERITIPRRSTNEVVLSDDGGISRTHAQIELIGRDWAIAGDGLSRNRTYVNGTRITRRLLADGDVLRLGATTVEFRSPRRARPR